MRSSAAHQFALDRASDQETSKTSSYLREANSSAAFEPSRLYWTRELETRRAAVARWRGTDNVSCERSLTGEQR